MLLIPAGIVLILGFTGVYYYYSKKKKEYNKLLSEQEVTLQRRAESIRKELVEKDKEFWESLRAANEEGYNLRQEALERALEQYKQQELEKLHQESVAEAEEWHRVIYDLKLQHEEVSEKLELEKQKQATINDAIRANIEAEEKEDLYKILISKNARDDIEVLLELSPKLHEPTILKKLIYETYVRRPLGEMIKRVLPPTKVSGIYKITYIKTGQSYIGQSTDIKNRWTEHIKSSLGIGSIATSTFHNHLAEKGLWNFHFQLLEEVEKDLLRERESYWIDYYDTVNIGLNMKR